MKRRMSRAEIVEQKRLEAQREKALKIHGLTVQLQFQQITLVEYRAAVKVLNAPKAKVVRAPKGFFEGKVRVRDLGQSGHDGERKGKA